MSSKGSATPQRGGCGAGFSGTDVSRKGAEPTDVRCQKPLAYVAAPESRMNIRASGARGPWFVNKLLAVALRRSPGQGDMVSLMVSMKTLQSVVDAENRPTSCSHGNPADGVNRPALLRF